MKASLPPLKSLQAFEAAARHESFLEAAEELSVTAGAISRHIKLLESFLDRALFARRSNGVALSRDGRRYATKTTAAFRDLAVATAEVKRARERRRLVISTLPVFSERWLNRRLPKFQRRHKNIDFQIEFYEGRQPGSRTNVDAWVCYSNGKHLSGDVTYLFSEELFPICSPEFCRHLLPNPDASSIVRLPRLHDMSWSTDWHDWARGIGAADADLSGGMRFALYTGVIQAATAGMGIAIGHGAMIGDELAAGRLVAFRHLAVASPRSYYLVMPQIAASRPVMRNLKEWLESESRLDAHLITEEAQSQSRTPPIAESSFQKKAVLDNQRLGLGGPGARAKVSRTDPTRR